MGRFIILRKNFSSRYFEDYEIGEVLLHAVPRSVSWGDVSLYISLTGSRFALHSSREYALSLGYRDLPVDDILCFHLVFGRTVADISLNSFANLGYAGCCFYSPLYVGDSVTASSEVIGLKENSDGKTGILYVRSQGFNQREEKILEYYRWLLLPKRDTSKQSSIRIVPQLPKQVPVSMMHIESGLDLSRWNESITGSLALWDDYEEGEIISHLDGQTIEEAEHQMATRLYQNNARVHFDGHGQALRGRFGKRIVYGGHIISILRALSCNGLANCFRISAINGGRHTSPAFAGDTIYGFTKIKEKSRLKGEDNIGVMRLRSLAVKDRDSIDFPADEETKLGPEVLLDLDYSVLIARR